MRQSESLAQDGDEDVDGDGDPDLGLHGVGRSAIEGLDPQMLLDPFEEQLDLPATTVKLCDDIAGSVILLVRNTKALWVSPSYRSTHLANSYFGTKSINWANTDRPSCMLYLPSGINRENRARLLRQIEMKKLRHVRFVSVKQG